MVRIKKKVLARKLNLEMDMTGLFKRQKGLI
jgi:hypothetical protein